MTQAVNSGVRRADKHAICMTAASAPESTPFSASGDTLQKVTTALLREWGAKFTVNRRGHFVDYDVDGVGPLSIAQRHRFRLFLQLATTLSLDGFQEEARANSRT